MAARAAQAETGMMAVTAQAVESRRAHRIAGKVMAHYQLRNSNDLGRDVFWVESYKPSGKFDSGYLVELADDNGHLWAACGCRWFLEFRKDNTVCKHILAAVDMQRERG